MRVSDVKKLHNGAYRVYWNKACGGGFSVATIGCTIEGDRWIAPCNWVNTGTLSPGTSYIGIWKNIIRVELLERENHDTH